MPADRAAGSRNRTLPKAREAFTQILAASAEAMGDAGGQDSLKEYAAQVFELLLIKPPGKPVLRHSPAAGGPMQGLNIEILNDDMPFLLDSVMGEIAAREIAVRRVLHPIFKTERDGEGRLVKIIGAGDGNWSDGRQESFISIEIDPLGGAEAAELLRTLEAILHEVHLAVRDWKPMLARIARETEGLRTAPPLISKDVLTESLAFLDWLRDGHMTVLGVREYRLDGPPDALDLASVEGSGLGLLSDPELMVLRRGTERLRLTSEIREFLFYPTPLILTKSSVLSRVHRRAQMDYVGIKTYGTDGALNGELRIIGLFTSGAYTEPARQIPLLRQKIDAVLKGLGYPPDSHDAKALVNVLESFPRDELFQIGTDRLQEWAVGILDLELRPRARLFMRIDRFERFVSALVYMPRDRFNTLVRRRIGEALAEACGGRVVTFKPYFPESPLVRVHFIIGRGEGAMPAIDAAALEERVVELTRNWSDQLAEALQGAAEAPADIAVERQRKYAQAFPAVYTDTFTARRAMHDIEAIERLGPAQPLVIEFYAADADAASRVRAALYRFDAPIPLSERVPLLENLGFRVIDESSFVLRPKLLEGSRPVMLHDMLLETEDGAPLDLDRDGLRLQDGFLAVASGAADNDGYNRLIVAAGASWREAAVLRTYGAYLRQIRSPFGQKYLSDTLLRHSGICRDLLELFVLRFDPDHPMSQAERAVSEEKVRTRVDGALARIESLDEDRILRQFLNLITATTRTNFYQKVFAASGDAGAEVPIAFKFRSHDIEAMPEPKPFAEIFVYSPRVEGVHLRFSEVARGGLRWSDRLQDYRTEVLGLARAQQVKNAVIVPNGAKGGFVPKQLPRSGTREAIQAEGIAAYKLFVGTLLDLTDNFKDGKVVPPARVVRHDGDDPYLVVAADKGTATFSDIANAISAEHAHWLGDAFASGGSAGYDHKGIGITARGTWECVKRHFREIGKDIQTEPFTVAGVGDMSGDVFGNGMLLSRQIKLIAAFDHRDVFLDPTPDPAASFAERKRLFELSRSSWQDYDKSLISRGGGVFSRKLKSIPLSDEVRALLGVAAKALSATDLMRAILKADVDLLWFGGIGTYIRAEDESDEQVGDRTNDAARVCGVDVRAKVIGEGANLAVTQRGRIEFALNGGRVDTDFIDNSAGVNTSDKEVNIKIALGPAVAAGRLTGDARKQLLAAMTDDVAASVLANNIEQGLALSLAEWRGASGVEDDLRLIRTLEAAQMLDRTLESLPKDNEAQARTTGGKGLTRPELAVLLSYTKIWLTRELLKSRLPDEPAVAGLLVGYFPKPMRELYAEGIAAHRLRREIIATALTNSIVNRAGAPAVSVLAEDTGLDPISASKALLAAERSLGIPELWQRVERLDSQVTSAHLLDLYVTLRRTVISGAEWLLRHGECGRPLDALIATYQPVMLELRQSFATTVPGAVQKAAAGPLPIANGIPLDLARDISALERQSHGFDVAVLAKESRRSVREAAEVYFAIGAYLQTPDILARGRDVPARDSYDRRAIGETLAMIAAAQRTIAAKALSSKRPWSFPSWSARIEERHARAKVMLDDIGRGGPITLARLMVAAAEIRSLIGAG